jgi:hypothetical protein
MDLPIIQDRLRPSAKALSNCFSSELPAICGVVFMSISVRMFPVGGKVSTYRVDASLKRSAHLQRATFWPPFTFFEPRSINFAIVVYSMLMHVEVDLH